MEESMVAVGGKLSRGVIDFRILKIPIFSKLNNTGPIIIGTYMKFIELSTGGIVFEQANRGDYLFFVLDSCQDVVREL